MVQKRYFYLSFVVLLGLILSACDFSLPWEVTLPGSEPQVEDQLMVTASGMRQLPLGDQSGVTTSSAGLPGYGSIWPSPANSDGTVTLSGDETVWGNWVIDWGDGIADTQTFPAFHSYGYDYRERLLTLRLCRIEDNLCINGQGWIISSTTAMSDLGLYPTFSITGIEPGNAGAQAISLDENRIRYMIADIQLGNVYDYYLGFVDQPDVAEAIRRWDSGDRVANLQDFHRIIVNDYWSVCFAGTTTQITGAEVSLTSD